MAFLPFFIALIVTLAWNLAAHPSLGLRAEMWAEAGTNYFFHAQFSDAWTAWTAVDAGYYPFLARLLSVFVHFLRVPVAQVPLVYQCVAQVLIAACSAVFAFPFFRPWVRSDAMRVAFCLGLLWFYDYELHTFINAPYYLAIPFFLILMSRRRWDRTEGKGGGRGFGWAMAVVGVAPLSKGLFIVFGPLCAALAFADRRDRKSRSLALNTVAIAAMAVQFAVMWAHRPDSAAKLDRVLLLKKSLMLSGMYFYSFFGGRVFPPDGPFVFLPYLKVAAIAFFAVALYRGGQWKRARPVDGLPLAAALITTVVSCGLVLASFADIFGLARHWDFFNFDDYLIRTRWGWIPMVALYFGFWISLSRCVRPRTPVLALGLCAFLLSSHVYGLRAFPRPYAWWTVDYPRYMFEKARWTIGYSNWKVLAPFFDFRPGETVCMPVNPLPWGVFHHCALLSDTAPSPGQWGLPHYRELDPRSTALPAGVRNGRVRLAMFWLRPGEDDAARRIFKLDLLGNQGEVIATIPSVPAAEGSPLTYFPVRTAVVGARAFRIRAVDEQGRVGATPIALGYSAAKDEPIWLWYGESK